MSIENITKQNFKDLYCRDLHVSGSIFSEKHIRKSNVNVFYGDENIGQINIFFYKVGGLVTMRFTRILWQIPAGADDPAAITFSIGGADTDGYIPLLPMKFPIRVIDSNDSVIGMIAIGYPNDDEDRIATITLASDANFRGLAGTTVGTGNNGDGNFYSTAISYVLPVNE